MINCYRRHHITLLGHVYNIPNQKFKNEKKIENVDSNLFLSSTELLSAEIC